MESGRNGHQVLNPSMSVSAVIFQFYNCDHIASKRFPRYFFEGSVSKLPLTSGPKPIHTRFPTTETEAMEHDQIRASHACNLSSNFVWDPHPASLLLQKREIFVPFFSSIRRIPRIPSHHPIPKSY